MAVYLVEATYKRNGNRRSRPIVADSAQDAKLIACAEWDIDERDPCFGWEVTERADPDGAYEAALIDSERRRLRMEAEAAWR